MFGRGQIIEHGTDFVTVQFSKTNEKKKFIYPSAIQAFLVLEDAETAKQYKKYSDEMVSHNAAAQAAAAERLILEKKAMQEHAKALKKSIKKPVKKAKAP
ncbi:hypothetical protein [Sporobacter termitidis]|uniref:hypothetical protein n=1 Tax=Sporobacter termitidis TaxID=44749 RepID=UPI0009354232|nr:hypothetical protein [Sporobacter termitidis]